jgi:hypothetical protein
VAKVLSTIKLNTITANKIEISKIFDWFEGDFKTKGSVIDFLNQYSAVKISSAAKTNYKVQLEFE